ncbi:MAG: polysaccharide deacetylase family protein [Acidobacteriota bacterium]
MKTALPPVWMYHHVEPPPLTPPATFPGSYLTPEELARQLDFLADRGLRGVSLRQAAGEPKNRRQVALTFDDGCRCFARHALPLLRARAMSATLFVVSGSLGGDNHWDRAAGERREELADGDTLRRLAAAGIEIGAHSRSHPRLDQLPAADLQAEIAGCRRDLETLLGEPVESFCYPYGRLDPASRAAVAAAGFTSAVSIHGFPHAHRRDRLAFPRMILGPTESSFDLWLKARGAYSWWSRLPRLGITAALRRWRRR